MSEITILPPIQNPAKYIAELFRQTLDDPRQIIPVDEYAGYPEIYYLSVADYPQTGGYGLTLDGVPATLDGDTWLVENEDDYWRNWGGTWDSPVGFGYQFFYIDRFLSRVMTASAMVETQFSCYFDIENDRIYIHIPRADWLIAQQSAGIYTNSSTVFSSAPKDENNLSDTFYGITRTYPRLKPPSVQNRLSDALSGIIVYNGFSISIFNNDGLLDGLDITSFYNTPIRISKTVENAQTIPEFLNIRSGNVSDISVAFDEVQISGADKLYTMGNEVCRRFGVAEFSSLPDDTTDKLIPVGWGALNGVELFLVATDESTYWDYVALDKDFLTLVSAVYNSDGSSIGFSVDYSTGIIRTAAEAESANVKGITASNSLGEIITDSMARSENLPYDSGLWDVTETDSYIDISPKLNFYYAGGNTRDLIQKVLKNDNVFLILKNNGLLTLRRWGETYNAYRIQSWMPTQKPKKDFKDATKYFCSSVQISSAKNYSSNKYTKVYADVSQEADISEKYRRSYTAKFELDIDDSDDIVDLADRILDRFGVVRETVSFGAGCDTSEINLLDTVWIDFNINGREFSQYSKWIVKGADPAQDTLILEGDAIGYTLTFDGIPAVLDTLYKWQIDN